MDKVQEPQFDAEKQANSCLCEKKQFAIGIASIVIGIGGLILASLI